MKTTRIMAVAALIVGSGVALQRPRRTSMSVPLTRNAEALRAAVDEERTVAVLKQQPPYRPTVSSHKHGNIARNPEGIHR